MPAWQRGLVGTLLAMGVLNWLGVTASLNRWLMDTHWRWQAALRKTPFPQDILVVAIDDKTLQKFGRLRYWSRVRYAQLLERLKEARVVGIDILFAEPDEHDPQGDTAFAQAIRRHGRVVLPFHQWQGRVLSAKKRVALQHLIDNFPSISSSERTLLPVLYFATLQPPIPILTGAACALGYADVNADPDGIYRAPVLLRMTEKGRVLPHFALAIACVAQGTSLQDTLQTKPLAVRFGQRSVMLDDGALWLRPIACRGDQFFGVGSPVPTVSFVDALLMPPEKFAGKIILVGETATGTTDVRPTPLDNGLRGVELNAEILANLLFLPPVRPLPAVLQWSLLLIAIGVPLALYTRFPVRTATVGALMALLIVVATMEAMFWGLGWLPAWGVPVLGWLSGTLLMGLQRLAEEEAQKRQIRQMFALYVAPEVVEEIVRNPSIAHQEGTRRRVAVLFSDIRGFTSYAEQNPPELVVRQMQEYLTEMTDAVQRHRGVLDKFIGDAVMALFGPFLPDDANVSALAILTALDMLERLEQLNRRWQREGLPTFRIGIGIHVGEAIVGNIGTPQRVQYTALGDAVNLASRLQTMTKDFKVPLLVSDEVRQEAIGSLDESIVFDELSTVTVRGRERPVRVFAVRRLEAHREVNSDVASLHQSQAQE